VSVDFALPPSRPASPAAAPVSAGQAMTVSGWLRLLLRRFACRLEPEDRALHVEDRLMLGGRKSVMLIACHGRRFLLASSGDSVSPLIEVQPLLGEFDPSPAEE
jgi:flagellar biogenesis protein FliO